MRKMVLGVALSTDKSEVVVIRKLKPAFMAGKLNVIGGKVEEGEELIDAMVREFSEAAGIETEPSEWTEMGNISGSDFYVGLYHRSNDDVFSLEPHGRIVDDGEVVSLRRVSSIPNQNPMGNLMEIIQAAIDNREIFLT